MKKPHVYDWFVGRRRSRLITWSAKHMLQCRKVGVLSVQEEEKKEKVLILSVSSADYWQKRILKLTIRQKEKNYGNVPKYRGDCKRVVSENGVFVQNQEKTLIINLYLVAPEKPQESRIDRRNYSEHRVEKKLSELIVITQMDTRKCCVALNFVARYLVIIRIDNCSIIILGVFLSSRFLKGSVFELNAQLMAKALTLFVAHQ